jgi:putative ABC transport system permease protein
LPADDGVGGGPPGARVQGRSGGVVLISTQVALGSRLVLRDRLRSLAGIAGIAAAVLIAFVEMGFMNGVIDSHLRVVAAARGDLVVLDVRRNHLNKWDSLLPIRAPQIAAVEGVASVSPVYQAGVPFRGAREQSDHRIIVIAFPPDDPPLDLGWSEATLQALRRPGTVLIDQLSRPIYGELKAGQDVWLDGRRLRLGGFVTLGPTVINDGQMVMSESTMQSMHRGAYPRMLVVRVRERGDVARVQSEIRDRLGPEVDVFRKSELALREASYLRRVAPLGLLFGAGMAAGLFVGMVICYQVLYIAVRRRLKAYATLKAMGFSNRFVLGTVVQQALVLGAGGYLAGLLLTAGAYALLAARTGLEIDLTLPRVAAMAAACALACAAAGAAAATKALRFKPADLL